MSESMRALDKGQLRGRHLLSLYDFTVDEIRYLLDQAHQLKAAVKNGIYTSELQGRSLGMIFENPSTRTRISFETGMTQLGGHALFLSGRDMQIGRGEPIKDTASVVTRYVDAVMIRTNSHEEVAEFASFANCPVINALTDAYHPCQALADLMTAEEVHGSLQGKKLAYVGDGNNVSHSLLAAGAKTGMDVSIAAPEGFEPEGFAIQQAKEAATTTGAKIHIGNDPVEAVTNADVVYTDVWASMGYESEQSERLQAFQPFQVNAGLMAEASTEAVFMHCLPAHREEEVSTAVIDGEQSVVYQQAENRLHVQKAVLASVIQ
ncbi:ornithine carbamoyltransferase [Salsuginibacillus halophilus]|uniref:Ornithine carbamoyltransferase n=1 Tax=Salsuginibacillus halophilus TaxID=517424 RepID=A0A2P8HXI3_9BACI|nr:ornithine carbamoyltransferase [Salsuginibacillus halophilus]PSL50936.1 ornithine carbamoyltransferase [Salsuginibacillus halophilus]